MKKLIILSSFFLLAVSSAVLAATNDFIADADITVSGVTFGSTTTDMTIMNGSAAESWSFNNGVFTVTNGDPTGPFKVSSADVNVKSFYVMSGSSVAACQENTTPGTSYVSVPANSGAYTLEPSANTNCQANCAQLTGVASYNHFPTCGAAVCSAGYTIFGSGASAVCNASAASVPSGGGGMTPAETFVAQPNATSTTQSYVAVSDGTVISSEIVAVKNNGVVVKTQVVAEINTTASTTKDQSIFLDSFLSSQIKKMTVALPAEVIQNVVNEYGHEKNIKAMIVSHDASDIQKTNTARQGMFLIGFDVFSVSLTVGDVSIEKFDKPLTLNFDVSNFITPDNFKAYFFNEATGIWEIIPGSVINEGVITVTVDHLTDFAIMKEIVSTSLTEILSNRITHWQQIMYEASAVYEGGSDVNKILEHNGKSQSTSTQKEYMAKYTEPLIKDVANLTQAQTYAINNFIVYGSKTAISLGAGERAGTVGSYKKAFGKLPKTEKEWIDCIAIGNGRYPGATSTAAESSAKKEFEKIYKRKPGDSNAHDKAATTIAAYGLRPNARNTNSEKAAIKSFKAIYKKNPSSAFDWDMVRVIAYSGAKR